MDYYFGSNVKAKLMILSTYIVMDKFWMKQTTIMSITQSAFGQLFYVILTVLFSILFFIYDDDVQFFLHNFYQ